MNPSDRGKFLFKFISISTILDCIGANGLDRRYIFDQKGVESAHQCSGLSVTDGENGIENKGD
jgi:hypothetical protein